MKVERWEFDEAIEVEVVGIDVLMRFGFQKVGGLRKRSFLTIFIWFLYYKKKNLPSLRHVYTGLQYNRKDIR